MVQLAASPEAVEAVRGLFQEYEAWLGIDLCFQSFEKELATLPGEYAPPGGALFVAREDETGPPVGCAGLRRLAADTVELKRLFVRPEFHGRGLGKQLLTAAIEQAMALGYQRMWLDTVPQLTTAIELYRRWGFREIPPYNHSPIAGALYFELSLPARVIA
ncbi:MAG: GNAT family N-acetyltransferase [Acidobacteria bacterium]|nr:GNAT family N-acetyltransferase [Acidobacteriota bacterium]